MEFAQKLAANKTRVKTFVDDVLIYGRMDRLAGCFDGDNYKQHTTRIAD